MFIQLIILTTVTLVLAQTPQSLFNLDCTDTPGTCNNICYAINCRASPSLLTFDSSNGNLAHRRKASGCKDDPCKKGQFSSFGNSCTDFPFSDTTQGGSDSILRCVGHSDASSEHEQLDKFYKTMKNGQPFGISITNFQNSSFCVDATNCVNDGGEIKLLNGHFDIARRTDGNPLFLPANSVSNSKNPFRKFIGTDGQIHLWLSNNNTGTLVGQSVLDGKGKEVLITSEVSSEVSS